MTNDELYLAISQLVKTNSKEMESHMDAMEDRLSNRIDNLDAKIDVVEARLSDRIDNLDAKIDMVEERLNNRIDNLDAKIDMVEERINNRIDNLDREMRSNDTRLEKQIKNIKMYLENVIEPRLQNIEECYTSTFDRYKVYAEKYEGLELDIEVIKSVVSKHNQILCQAPA